MQQETRRRSRWVIRAMEWDDDRARYPNIWHEGMPNQILAFDRVAGRLRLGDLIAVYYPSTQRHNDRSEKFVGLSRVVGMRRSHRPGFYWIDLETAHRFEPPLDAGQHPRRVFLCCDPGWPDPEVDLFRKVFDAAVAAGWQPSEEEQEGGPIDAATPAVQHAPAEESIAADDPSSTAPQTVVTETAVVSDEPLRLFAGVAYGGDMRDPRHDTWLAMIRLIGERLEVVRLDATGRSGLQAYLRDPDRALMGVEAIGMNFPFGLPLPFAETLLGGSFPEEGWWALVRKIEKISWPDYLIAIQEFRENQGEAKRLTDDRTTAPSPLHRVDPDLGSTAFHGIRMIAEDRSRYAVRPFESAQGQRLLEVCPQAAIRALSAPGNAITQPGARDEVVRALGAAGSLPVALDPAVRRSCHGSRSALEAVVAARCAAVAVLAGEADKAPDELSPGDGDRIRREGWIYGLQEPA